MSLLHQDTPDEIDDAARGEELTKGTSHVVVAAVIATLLVSAAIAIYFIAGQKPPVATGDIIAVWAHPHHAETSGLDANGASMAKESFDQVLVFTQVRLHNQSNTPLFLVSILTNATLDDGIHSSYAASEVDYNRVFLAYPGPHRSPRPRAAAQSHPAARTVRRRNLRLILPRQQTTMGRAQEPELQH